jgi:opacity protein-like surface antigen
MNKILLIGSALAVLAIGPARAADLPSKAPVVTGYNWTGFYIGAYGGYGTANFLPPTQTTGLASNIPLAGGLGGVEIGYNYQFAPHWLLGVEQDVSLGRISGSQSQPFPNPTINAETDYSGTIRSRFGYIWGRTLFYETVGVAWASNKVDLQFQNAAQLAAAGGGGANLDISESHLQFGVAVGAGMEWAVDTNLSLKVEYLYSYLTKEQYFAGSNFAGLVGWPLSTVRAGVNWRFN